MVQEKMDIGLQDLHAANMKKRNIWQLPDFVSLR